MLGKVLIGLLVAAGLFLVYSLLAGGTANAATGQGASPGGSGSRPLDRGGTYTGSGGSGGMSSRGNYGQSDIGPKATDLLKMTTDQQNLALQGKNTVRIGFNNVRFR